MTQAARTNDNPVPQETMLTEAIIDKIQHLKKQRNAVILAHNYQIGEVQDIADFTGDSGRLALFGMKLHGEDPLSAENSPAAG